ncbi:MAG TPA: SDR family NAD(P)-dependent oxidoreductase, partial [Naasia sp.]
MTTLPLPASMAGRTVVITGGSSGIGAAAARTLAALGAEVAVVGRNAERTRKVAEEVGGEAFLADFGRLAEVRALGERLLERYPRISVLANNAGAHRRIRERTVDGHELTLQENVLGGVL